MTRLDRVAEFIRAEISTILKKKVNDPRIGFVSFTGVIMSPDLKYAKIFVSVLGDETEKLKTLEGLNSAKSFIRGELGRVLELRLVPELNFVRDDSLEKGDRILDLLSKIKRPGVKNAFKKPKSSRPPAKKRK
ncbi:MAG: 30S ribosome-binding factor RbfA [Candidatus Margulisiibacteriota bacterium]